MRKKLLAIVFLAASLFALALLSLGGKTQAYLQDRTDPVTNSFTPASVSCRVEETFDGTTKKDVRIQNTGSASAEVRAMVLVNWKDKDGNIYGKAPKAGIDYSITYNSGSKWSNEGDYWLYTEPVAAGEDTDVLVTECRENTSNRPEGYTLSVEILADAIQSER